MAKVAASEPGFFNTLPELAEAVISRLMEPANIGNIENVNRSAPTFCNNSPAFASVMKNGGTVTNSKTMLALSSEADHTGALAE